MSKSEDCSLFLQYQKLTVAYKTQYKLFICDPWLHPRWHSEYLFCWAGFILIEWYKTIQHGPASAFPGLEMTVLWTKLWTCLWAWLLVYICLLGQWNKCVQSLSYFPGLLHESASGRQQAMRFELYCIRTRRYWSQDITLQWKWEAKKKSLIWLINSTLASYTWFTNFLVTMANILSQPHLNLLLSPFWDFLLSTYNCWVITNETWYSP